jgi:HEAT repeat protein
VLQDLEGPNRDKAAVALGIAEGPKVVQPLIHALADKNAQLRREATAALGRLKDMRAAPPLIGALSDGDEAVSRECQEALEELTAQKFGKDPARWQERWRANKKE